MIEMSNIDGIILGIILVITGSIALIIMATVDIREYLERKRINKK